MELRELGEFGWIAGIREKFRGVPSGESLGIGDDCAVIPCGDGEALVVTTDMLIEDVHFLRAVIPPYLLGRKSLAVNLSDVASMGAVPIASFLSIALPGDVSAGWADRFTDGYRSLSEEFGVPLLGGDTTSSQDRIAINVTAIGRIARAKVKYRSGARENDIVYVTGYLGDSAQGLLDIRSGAYDSPFVAVHHDPHPCVNEGIWLGNQPEVHAMMDISDGLASDLSHILEESKTGAEISIERIPTRTTVEPGRYGRRRLPVAADRRSRSRRPDCGGVRPAFREAVVRDRSDTIRSAGYNLVGQRGGRPTAVEGFSSFFDRSRTRYRCMWRR